jgi:hypothetical protein
MIEIAAPSTALLRAFRPEQMPFLSQESPPTLSNLASQLCTASQFAEPIYARWCSALKEEPEFRRKQWEFVYICEALQRNNMLTEGRRGLGFGVGKEPLPALFASLGCEVLATDLDPSAPASSDWISTDQHATQLADLNEKGICDSALFAKRVRFRSEDMNRISSDLVDFDFTWSSCAFEHLGSIRHGIDFFINSLKCLRPGGVAVHTTEFNLSSNFSTIEAHNLVLFRRFDIEDLERKVKAAGCKLLPINYHPGNAPVDRHYDIPPYANTHLRMQLDRYVFTSIGLVAIRNTEAR